MVDELSKSIQFIKTIGPKRAESFAKIGINVIRDLLFYFPTRYLDRSNILSSSQVIQYLINGYVGEVTIIGKVVDSEVHYYNKKQVFKVRMKDNSGFFECVWFQGAKFFKDVFNEGQYFAISSKPILTKYGHLQFAHPDFDRLAEKESSDFLNTGKIIPFYRVPKLLRDKNIGDFSLRRIISYALDEYSKFIKESLPEDIIANNNLLKLQDTIKELHYPSSNSTLFNAKHRMKYEEIFYFECMVALKRKQLSNISKTIPFKINPNPLKQFLKALPFELTNEQLKVLHEIRKDLESPKPMNRLLQGDVGSGKTIVALISILIAADNGYQSAFLVPTEILADQHFRNINSLLNIFNINCELLIGGQNKASRLASLESIKSGKSKVIIGTHALLEDNIEFHKLGLIIIDEQHRFGVLQRQTLLKKGESPNVLIMTATPIPRTLSMTLYGDLDISTINELPKNRIPIKTSLRAEDKLNSIFKFTLEKIKEGYQAFIVYPLVDESDKIELKAATKHYEELSNGVFKDLKIGLIHGKINWREKEQIMLDFAAKKYDILVSTTVIEVGIDIPDANIIIINDAERFGLSQLHQLRGRVGRSNKQAFCILITKENIASKSSIQELNLEYLSPTQIEKHKSAIRLNAMIKYNSGFDLAEIDFKLRGPGNIFGTEQSGLPEFKFINIVEDAEIISKAKEDAFKIIDNDLLLTTKYYQVIKNNLENYYSHIIQLSHIG